MYCMVQIIRVPLHTLIHTLLRRDVSAIEQFCHFTYFRIFSFTRVQSVLLQIKYMNLFFCSYQIF
jgi:hypothetical protein